MSEPREFDLEPEADRDILESIPSLGSSERELDYDHDGSSNSSTQSPDSSAADSNFTASSSTLGASLGQFVPDIAVQPAFDSNPEQLQLLWAADAMMGDLIDSQHVR